MLAHGDSLLLHKRTRDRQTAAERRSPLGSAKDGRTPTSGAYGDAPADHPSRGTMNNYAAHA
jgi:hypothetical protein